MEAEEKLKQWYAIVIRQQFQQIQAVVVLRLKRANSFLSTGCMFCRLYSGSVAIHSNGRCSKQFWLWKSVSILRRNARTDCC